jgi:hypothetical protein
LPSTSKAASPVFTSEIVGGGTELVADAGIVAETGVVVVVVVVVDEFVGRTLFGAMVGIDAWPCGTVVPGV